MSIVNRRNSFLGYTVWALAKTELKRKARAAVPGTVGGTYRPNRSATALAGIAAVSGAVLVWRRHGHGTELAPS
jgi:hypothetical protein